MIRCILSTRCILKRLHFYVFTCILTHTIPCASYNVHTNAFERILTHHDAFVCIHKRVASNGKARELLTTSGGAPKPEPELWVRVAQQARALGDLAGSVVSMWIVEVLGANPHQLGDLRGLLLGAAHLRGNVADVLGLDVAVLVALLRVHRRELEYEFMQNYAHECIIVRMH